MSSEKFESIEDDLRSVLKDIKSKEEKLTGYTGGKKIACTSMQGILLPLCKCFGENCYFLGDFFLYKESLFPE